MADNSGLGSWGTSDSTSYPGSDSWGGTGNGGVWSDWGQPDSVNYPGSDSFDSPNDYTTGGWDDVNSSQYTPQSDGNTADFDDPNSFWNRSKRILLGQGANMLGEAAGVPGPVVNGLMSAAQAPDGRRMNAGGDAMGRGIVNTMVGAINPALGLMNTLSGLFTGKSIGSMMPRGASSGMGYGESTGRGGTGSMLGNVVGGLGALYGYNQASKGLNSQIGGLQGLYGQNSPYAQTLRQQLERKDAAAGRRSQYGPREVQLQAALADKTAGVSDTIGRLATSNQNNQLALAKQKNQTRAQQLALLMNMGKQSGAFGALNNMFRNPTPEVTYDDSTWMGSE